MITKFKIFENLNEGELEVGDYVICKENILGYNHIWEDIGVIQHQNNPKNNKRCINVRFYPNLPDKSDSWTRWFSRDEILYWSKDINDIYMIKNSGKFNI